MKKQTASATLGQIVDPSLPIHDLEALASDAAARSWDESLKGGQSQERYDELTEEMNAYLYIAWLTKRGFTVSR